MRGKHVNIALFSAASRITPADAGKTDFGRNGRSFSRDHPRGCGENLSPKPLRLTSTGSPPRMRGKLYGCRHSPWQLGDHPRGCGENLHRLPPFTCRRGSPPRMRGKQLAAFVSAQLKRITPADAGKTREGWYLFPHSEDPPRGCGENAADTDC